MTDNTQELDEILANLTAAASDDQFIDDGSIKDARVDILDWHNKQVEAVLDRIENSPNGANSGTQAHVMINEAIRAERNKLNNSDGDVK